MITKVPFAAARLAAGSSPRRVKAVWAKTVVENMGRVNKMKVRKRIVSTFVI